MISSIFIFFIFGIGAIFVVDDILIYAYQKGLSFAGRELFVEDYLSKFSDSIIYKIFSLPLYYRIPVGGTFFFFLPYFNFNYITEGVFNLRKFITEFIMPLLFIIYFGWLFRGVTLAFIKKNYTILKFFFILIFLVVLISQFSIQVRHKTMIMPLFYILIAFGFYSTNRTSIVFGNFVSLFLIVLQFVFLFY
jgi:hypothetical protein